MRLLVLLFMVSALKFWRECKLWKLALCFYTCGQIYMNLSSLDWYLKDSHIPFETVKYTRILCTCFQTSRLALTVQKLQLSYYLASESCCCPNHRIVYTWAGRWMQLTSSGGNQQGFRPFEEQRREQSLLFLLPLHPHMQPDIQPNIQLDAWFRRTRRKQEVQESYSKLGKITSQRDFWNALN